MKLLELIKELDRNPHLIHEIEVEINKAAHQPDLSQIYDLAQIEDFKVRMFLWKILEIRIKSKRNAVSELLDEIAFVESLLAKSQSPQLIDLYTLLALYCWPSFMNNFYPFLQNNLDKEIGLKVFVSFLSQINYCSDIDQLRRAELKKAVKMILPELLPRFSPDFPQHLIQIFTHLLKIAPRHFDYSLVYEKAPEFPFPAIEFFTELGGVNLDLSKFREILGELPPDPSLCEFVTGLKKFNDEVLARFIYECTAYEDCVSVCLVFWHKFFQSPGKEAFVSPVLRRVFECQESMDEDERADLDNSIFSLLIVLVENTPESLVLFLGEGADKMPRKFVGSIIQKLARKEGGKFLREIRNNVRLGSKYLNILVCYYAKDPNTPSLIETMDFNDKDQVRLAGSIVETFQIEHEQLLRILKITDRLDNAYELKALISAQLNIVEDFSGNFNNQKALKFYYFLKKDQTNFYDQFGPGFYRFFLSNAPFDRCFAVLEKLGVQNIPVEIYQKIYDSMETMPLEDLNCFNHDLLPFLEFSKAKFFVEKEVSHLQRTWTNVNSHKEYNHALKSLITYLEKGVNSKYPDLLISLLTIDYPAMINKVLGIFNGCNETFDVNKAVYELLVAYNLPHLVSCQANIVFALVKCMKAEEGPVAFQTVAKLDHSSCISCRNQILKMDKKSSAALIKRLIKDFKANSLNKLHEEEVKVGQHNFLPRKASPAQETVPDLN